MDTHQIVTTPSYWRFIGYTAGIGAVLAGLSIYYLVIKPRKAKCSKKHKDVSNMVSCKLERMREAVQEAKLDFQEQLESLGDNFNDQLETLINEIKKKYLSQEMREAIDTIQIVLDKLKEFDMEAKQYDGYGFLLLALVKQAQMSIEKPADVETKFTRLTSKQFEDAKRFGHYAVRMYPLSWVGSLEAIAKDLGVPEDSIIMVHFTDADDGGHCPKFILFLDHEVKSVVLAIRGTFSPKDIILDAVAEEVPFLDGMAHKGILSGSKIILDKVLDSIISNLRMFPGYKLTITGHSLGAGTAELVSMQLLSSPKMLPFNTQVQCVALAPPPVYRSNKKIPQSLSSSIQIYINNYDCVPSLSLSSVAKLLAAVRAVDHLGLSLSQQLSILAERPGHEEQIAKINAAVVGIKQDQFPDLEHPGTVFHMVKCDNDKHVVYLSKSKIFTDSILLIENMIMDHLHTTYENVLQSIKTLESN